MRLGGPHSRSVSGGEEKNSQPLPGLKPPIIQPVAERYTTKLSRIIIIIIIIIIRRRRRRRRRREDLIAQSV
jgi:hypothetical protein